jgi:DNA ligase (NAD+)
MEGFGEKSVRNIGAAIEKSRDVHPVNLIFALCIPMIGIDAAKKIVRTIGFDKFLERMELGIDFSDIEGIGAEKSASIFQWYSHGNNRGELEHLLREIRVEHVEQEDVSRGRCVGVTFVITGDVHEFQNRDAFKAYVESQGGKVVGSVSKKTSYLVNNDTESASSKNRKAKELGIPVISEAQFIEMFGK